MDLDKLASFCKRTGIIFPNSEIYGGFAGFWDYGPVGVQIKKNIKDLWWKEFVENREDVVGIDGAIITNPEVWEASGHLESFADPLLDCKKCSKRFRGDHLIEGELGIAADGIPPEKIDELIKENDIKCPSCGGELTDIRSFNLMFDTNVGPIRKEENTAYLRPETAQLIFTNFRLAKESSRQKLPFGIAQMGKAFRNEVSPRNFIFRVRELELMEIEYFVHPDKINECPLLNDEIKDYRIQILTGEMQEEDKDMVETTVGEALDRGWIETPWHAYWLYQHYRWFVDLGVDPENIRLREHMENEMAHYANFCYDIEYKFDFGWKEVLGNADRGTFDLTQHIERSGKNLKVHDQEKGENIIPHVASEPSQGVERTMLVFIDDAYEEEDDRAVMKLHPKLAPVKCRIFPLMTKDGLDDRAREIHKSLKEELHVEYEERGSIGKRYARADEIGVPYCVTVDYDTLEDDTVTIRDRDSTEQVRVKAGELPEILGKLICGKVEFKELKN